MNISISDVETGVIAPGAPGTPTPLAVTGLTAGGSGSQSFTNGQGTTLASSGTGSKSHHHE